MKRKTSGTTEWTTLKGKRGQNINDHTGCMNNCVYCYSAGINEIYHWHQDPWKEMSPKDKVKIAHRNGITMYPSAHDLFLENLPIILSTIQEILEKDNKLLIVSKPRSEVIEAICEKFSNFKDRIEFRFTITSLDDDKDLPWYEPHAPTAVERGFSLSHAFENGFMTSVSCEPFLQDPIELYEYVRHLLTDQHLDNSSWAFWIGPMNQRFCPPEYWREELWGNEALLALFRKIKTLNNPQIRMKDSLRLLFQPNGNVSKLDRFFEVQA